MKKLDMAQELPGLDPASRQARDIERFRWFSQDYLSLRATENLIIDVRYSAVPNEAQPLWGIRIDPRTPDAHVEWWTDRETDARQRDQLGALLAGDGCEP